MLNYGTAGIGTNPHVAGELFNLLAKVNTVAVHFKGGAPALIAVMAGEIGFVYNGPRARCPTSGPGASVPSR